MQWIHFEWHLKENRDQVQWDCDILKMSSSLCRYSFSVPPKLDLHVRPKLGEREVTLCHVTEWIEKKLQDEFQVKEKGGNPVEFCHLLCFNLFSHFPHLFTRKSLSCQTWMTFIYPWCTRGWTVFTRATISRHALGAPPWNRWREFQQTWTSASLTEGDSEPQEKEEKMKKLCL